jgi:formylglycine-generating enzyme required for sulfatase activity
MKTCKQRAFSPWVIAAMVAILIGGFAFTGCSDSGGGDITLEVPIVAVTGVTLAPATLNLNAGENESLTYTVLPTDATNKTVIWSSSDTDVAIASEGNVYAVGEGTATITVTTRDGGKKATSTVTVNGNIPVTGLEMEKAVFLVVGDIRPLTPVFTPENASPFNKRLNWVSFNPSVATVDNGTVTPVATGKTFITATTLDGKFEATCAITVVTEIPEVENMVWIHPGTFIMGSPYTEPSRVGNEEPHQVTMSEGFYIGKYPITQAEWIDVMVTNPSAQPSSTSPYTARRSELPVDQVTWFMALVYCNRRSLNEGISPVYSIYKNTAPNANSADPDGKENPDIAWEDIPANWSTDPDEWGIYPTSVANGLTRWNRVRMVAYAPGYRLPTEAQWEYACRAGSTTPFNFAAYDYDDPIYDYDDPIYDLTKPIYDDNTGEVIGYEIKSYAIIGYPQIGWGTSIISDTWAQVDTSYNVYNGGPQGPSYRSYTAPVSFYEDWPNAWGVEGMHGNINEWVWDWYGNYDVSVDTDPTGPATGTYRVARGGSYYDYAYQVRSAWRWVTYTPQTNTRLGLRVVRSYTGE